MEVDLKEKVALVTGAARGIGQAIGDAFSANGARTIFADIDIQAASQSAAKWPSASALLMDVTDQQQVETAIRQILEEHGRLDILVNNAGVNTHNHRVNIDQYSIDEWERILHLNLTGLFYVSRAASRPMLAQKSGRIINIASVVGLVPTRLQSPFIAAKAGVINLTKSMALELGNQGVMVNCIAPGSILTDGTRKLFYEKDATFSAHVGEMLAHIPLGRPGTCAEVASAALFFAAPESSYINGAVLPVDGGWLAGYIRDF